MVKERPVQQVAQVQLQCWLAQMHHLKFLQFDKIISDTRSTFINRILLQDRIHKSFINRSVSQIRDQRTKKYPTQEYPIVDGPLSIKQYYDALDKCYQGWRIKSKNVSDNSGPGHQVKPDVKPGPAKTESFLGLGKSWLHLFSLPLLKIGSKIICQINL